MKKILLVVFAIMLTVGGFSQTYYNWDFSTRTQSSLPTGFVTWNLDDNTVNANLNQYMNYYFNTEFNANGWVMFPETNYNYGFVACSSDFTPAGTCNRWLVTPQITVPAGIPTVALEWNANSGDPNQQYPDNYSVLVSTTDSATGSFTTTLTTITHENFYGTTHVLPLYGYAGQTIRVAFVDNTTNGVYLQINNIEVLKLPASSIAVNDVEIYEHNYLNNPVSVTGLFTNTGLDNINSYVLNYSVNGGAPVASPVVYNAGIIAQQQYYYTHPIPFNPATAGAYTVSVWFSNLNGLPINSDTSSVSLFFYPQVPGVVKNVVVEEMTGAGCPWCPGGALALRDLHDAVPYVIPIAIHSTDINDLNVSPSDAMQITAGQTVVDYCASGFPTGMVDRLYSFDNLTLSPSFSNDYYRGPSQLTTNDIWYNLSALRKVQATPLNVTMSVVSFDSTSSTNNLTVTVNANFLNSLSKGTYNINLYVVEDSVLTPTGNNGNGYNQDNGAYSSAAGQTTNYNELYNLPSVLVDNGHVGEYAQNHVLRAMAGGAWGTTGVIPSNPSAGTTYSHTFTVSVPSTWRYDYLKLVGLVQEYSSNVNNRTILNAVEGNLINAPRNCPVIAVSDTQISATSAYAIALGGTAPYTYSWSTVAQTTDTATGLSVGSTYIITVTDNNGCTGVGNATISPASCPIITTTTTLLAPSSSATVSASGGSSPYRYIWSTTPAQTTATATSLTPGVTYTVTVIDNNGCTASASATLELCPTINAFVSQIGTSTSANITVAGGESPYTYHWASSPVQNGDTATGLTVGSTYAVTISDNNGCTTSGSVTIEAVCPVIAATTTQVGGSQAYASASGGAGPYTYNWSDGQSTDTANLLIIGNSYTVTVIDQNGCLGVDSISIVSGIRSIADITDFSIYPNPSSGVFTASIHLASSSSVTITIMDLTGNTVYESTENNVKDMDKQINIGRVAAGMYFVNLKTEQGAVNQRIIIK